MPKVAAISLFLKFKVEYKKINWGDRSLYLFINGNKFEKGEPINYSLQDGILNIGRQASNSMEYWNGSIDQIRISDIARYTEDYSSNFEFNFTNLPVRNKFNQVF